MTKQTLTPWFPPDVTPVREGVYQVEQYEKITWYSYWDGNKWGWVSENREWAVEGYMDIPEVRYSAFKWRGLTEQPK